MQGSTDSPLAKDVDLARAKLGLVGANGEQGLYGIVRESRYLRVDSIAGELHLKVSSVRTEDQVVGSHHQSEVSQV